VTVGVVPKNDFAAIFSRYPVDTLSEVGVPLLTKGVFISDCSLDVNPFPFSTFNVLGFVIVVTFIYPSIHYKVLVWSENAKTGARLANRLENVFIRQRKLQNSRFCCVFDIVGWGLSGIDEYRFYFKSIFSVLKNSGADFNRQIRSDLLGSAFGDDDDIFGSNCRGFRSLESIRVDLLT
jgi:hypothetical protein